MSDVFTTYCNAKFESRLCQFSSTELSPNLHRDFLDRAKIALTIELRNPFIAELQKARQKFQDYSYIKILNTQIKAFQLKETDRLEERLRNICCRVSMKYRTTHRSGSKRLNFDTAATKIAIFDTELENVSELSFKLSKFEQSNIELVAKCKTLYEELSHELKCKENNQKQYQKLEELVLSLRQENEDLTRIMDILEKRKLAKNNGKEVDELERSQRYAKLTSLKSMTEKALWFAESYGLTPKSLTFQSKTGQNVNLQLGESKQLEEENELRMKEILFLLDKFAIGDQAYHELAIKTDDLPKLYLIKNFRDKLNQQIHLERTPGNVPGAFINFRDELESSIRHLLKSTSDTDKPSKFTVKVSGDGTKVSRISNYVVISFVLVDDERSMSVLNQKTLAEVKCSETYENLEQSLSPVFDSINKLYEEKRLTVDGRAYEIEVVFGGDMKFLQLCLGLSSSIAEYACPWCKVPKSGRGDITKDRDYYHQPEQRRTILEIAEQSKKSKKSFSVKNHPLIKIEPDHVIPDELHLTMRIFDILLRNIIDDASDKDDKAAADRRKTNYLASLVTKINECGVSFNIWRPKNGNSERDWTSLRGDDVKKVLRNLPEKLMFNIHNETHDETVKLWKDFSELLHLVNSPVIETKSPEFVFSKCKTWLSDFLALGKAKRKGYSPENVTPYMHTLVYHVPFFVNKYGQLKKFSGQAVEKVNDNIKTMYHQKTNKVDCAVDTMKARKRLEMLSNDMERTKRQYNKKKDEWWERDIFRDRNEKRETVLREIGNAATQFTTAHEKFITDLHVNDLSTEDIKEKLSNLGIVTKLRKKEKLIALLKEKMKD